MTVTTASEIRGESPKSQSRRESPGALRSLVTMEIQTRQAQRLVYGRKASEDKHGIVGLLRFAALLRPIWSGAAADDPYADWRLVLIEREMTAAREHLQQSREHVAQVLGNAPAVDIKVAQSIEPIKVELVFNNPCAYHGAYLLGEYDALVRTVLTARHVGLLDRGTAERVLREGGRAVRRVYSLAQGYRYLGVTRDDVRQGTARAIRAREMMDPVPQEVLDGTLRASLAPEIRRSAESIVEEEDDDVALGKEAGMGAAV